MTIIKWDQSAGLYNVTVTDSSGRCVLIQLLPDVFVECKAPGILIANVKSILDARAHTKLTSGAALTKQSDYEEVRSSIHRHPLEHLAPTLNAYDPTTGPEEAE